MNRTVKAALFGSNGHQLNAEALKACGAELIAACECENHGGENIAVYDTLEEMLENSEIEFISICSPVRSEQAGHIKAALLKNKHVLCEKPCALTESDIDELVALSEEKGLIFAEMNNVMFEQPYAKARQLIENGEIGTIVQVTVQKSYPYADWRPQNEDIDGGLIMQIAIYGTRFIEQVVNEEIDTINAIETSLGNPKNGNLKLACNLQCTLKNKGVATVNANYLNTAIDGAWAFEELKVFGTNGIICTDCAEKSVQLRKNGKLTIFKEPDLQSQLSRIIESIANNKKFSLGAKKMMNATKLVARAKQNAVALK